MNVTRGGKSLFIGLLGLIGYILGEWQGTGCYSGYVGAIWGGVLAVLIIGVEWKIQNIPSRILLGGMLGGMLGITLTSLLVKCSLGVFPGKPLWTISIQSSLLCFCSTLGVMIGSKRIQHISPASLKQIFSDQHSNKNYKILDTSVIIDGRIADLSETGFLEGVLILPQFILTELQHIADSSDSIKRNRGRRGLDMLHKIQKRVDIQVEISEQDFPKIKEIDAKLVELGKLMQAKLITNDFNLNKVAELQGVPVLNVNKLANALKPVVLPGEVIEVQVLKEGKEYGQGVAYLDDGTMIVIDHAKKLIGHTVNISVTSVLQTTAGRMIFGQLASSS